MREIRPYGSVRGVRSNPYPYRDILSTAAQQREFYAAASNNITTAIQVTKNSRERPLILLENRAVHGPYFVLTKALQQPSIDPRRRISVHAFPRGTIQPISVLADFLD
jgi:hypothetical protein